MPVWSCLVLLRDGVKKSQDMEFSAFAFLLGEDKMALQHDTLLIFRAPLKEW